MSVDQAVTHAYPAKLKYVGSIAEEYVTRRASQSTWGWEQEQVRAWVAGRPAGSSVLDVPFGSGRYVPLYRARGLKVRGCDISADMIALAKRELGRVFDECDVHVADAEDMRRLAVGAVDAVLCSRFIQWLPELQIVDRILAEFARVAREELFLQLHLPAAADRPPPPLARRIGGLLRSPLATARRIRRRLQRHPSTDWQIYLHREPDVLALARANGWLLAEIGEECPTSPGLRFYRFRKQT
jgi:SAM-dependent methyltransferase